MTVYREVGQGLMGLLCVAFGAPITLLGLLRLGWGRHGEHSKDFGFLHLDWVMKPSLPYWGAHVSNLVFTAVGITLMIAGVMLFIWALDHLGRRALKRARSEPGR